jgi:mannitol/fructose-specific phosphotransferase system IIA component (Ntr-type)
VKLQKLIDTEQVFLGLEASSKDEVLAVLAEQLATEVGLDAKDVAAALRERERLGSTSVGDGFAIPHCKLKGLSSIQLALGRFLHGVDFNAADGKLVTFFFVVLSPPDQPAAHLQVLSQIARVLKRGDLRRDLIAAREAEGVVRAIRQTAAAEGL